MQEKLIAFINFVHSSAFLYIICACWLVNVIVFKAENRKLNQKISHLQLENATLQKAFNCATSETGKDVVNND